MATRTKGHFSVPRPTVLVLVLMTIAPVDAEVRDANDINNCGDYFYQKSPPQIDPPGARLKAMCQTYSNKRYFATLFDSRAKIPVYSAYRGEDIPRLDKTCPQRPSTWFNEPQLESITTDKNMVRVPSKLWETYTHQATDLTYKGQGQTYHKGHVNPACLHDTPDAVAATFTYTNAVPQFRKFNYPEWFTKVEKPTRDAMRERCAFEGAKRYIVTGAVASTKTIGDHQVSVPSHMWSAVCCDSSKAEDWSKGWSMAYYGENKVGGTVRAVSVAELNRKLQDLYGVRVQIFQDYTFRPDMDWKRARSDDTGGQNAAPEPKKFKQVGPPGSRDGPAFRENVRNNEALSSGRPVVKNCDFGSL